MHAEGVGVPCGPAQLDALVSAVCIVAIARMPYTVL